MLVREVPYKDPVATFAILRERPYSFFLDSGMDPERLGRYSVQGSDPFLVLKSRGQETALLENGIWKRKKEDPFRVLRALCSKYHVAEDPRLPLPAGAFGYFAYDLGRQIMKLPRIATDDLCLPEAYLGFYDRLVIYDHRQQKMYLSSTGKPEQGNKAEIRAEERLQELEIFLQQNEDGRLTDTFTGCSCIRNGEKGTKSPVIRGHFNYASYCAAIEKVKDSINRGEIMEGIISQRFSCRVDAEPWHVYLQLRKINPAPFAAYLHYPELDVVCASPERFLKVTDGYIESRPIKGTRPRGENALEDRRLRSELLHSNKDHVELDIITSLVVRELQQVCSQNSVNVQERFRLEEYPTVFHLVSTVRGRLAQDKDLIDLLRATFPAGSISGTPKLGAMEIIEALEPVRRGIYTGSIGYLGFDGSADLNVVIRTIIMKDGIAYIHAGGGIVTDSQPDEEYHETITKARALFTALGHEGEVRVCQK